MDCGFVETSAKTGNNVKDIWEAVFQKYRDLQFSKKRSKKLIMSMHFEKVKKGSFFSNFSKSFLNVF